MIKNNKDQIMQLPPTKPMLKPLEVKNKPNFIGVLQTKGKPMRKLVDVVNGKPIFVNYHGRPTTYGKPFISKGRPILKPINNTTVAQQIVQQDAIQSQDQTPQVVPAAIVQPTQQVQTPVVMQRAKPKVSYGTTPNPKHSQKTTTINGQVVDESGMPLPYVNISAGQRGTVSNDDGYFTFSPQGEKALRFDFLGFKTVEYPINKVPAKVVLKEDIETLDTVDLGTIKPKKDNTALLVVGGILGIFAIAAIATKYSVKKGLKGAVIEVEL